ncbi:MAG: GNAT family N-acetyltransferase [bacterium]
MPGCDTLVIREVEAHDMDALAHFLEAHNTPATTGHFNPFPMTAETARRIATTPRHDHYYIAILNGRIAGLSMLRGWDEGYETPSFGIVIDRDRRGMGLGRKLTIETIGNARRLGCRQVRLTVNAGNHAGVRLYESLGFSRQSEHPTLTHGKPDTKIVMITTL